MWGAIEKFLAPAGIVAALFGALGLAFNIMLAVRVGFSAGSYSAISDNAIAAGALFLPTFVTSIGLAPIVILVALVGGIVLRFAWLVKRHVFEGVFWAIELPSRAEEPFWGRSAEQERENKGASPGRRYLLVVLAPVLAVYGAVALAITVTTVSRYQWELKEYAARSIEPVVGSEKERPVHEPGIVSVGQVAKAYLGFLHLATARWDWWMPGFEEKVMENAAWLDGLVIHPKLVLVTADPGFLKNRPMILIVETTERIVLYDFLADEKPDDDIIDPIVTFRQSEITAVTALDPYAIASADGADELRWPILTLIQSRCRTGVEEVLKQLTKAHLGSKAPPRRSPDYRAIFVSHYVSDEKSDLCDAPPPVVDDKKTAPVLSVDNLTVSLNSQSAIRIVMPDNPLHGTPPKEIGTEGTPTLLRPWRGIYPYGLPEEAVMLDNLSACRILTPWSAEEFGLEFSRAGGARVEGRTAHDLVLTKLTSGIDPWDRLLQVFDEWSNEIETLSRHEGSDIPVVLLFGGTSQDGTVGENLDRAIDRAEAVKKALTGYWADRGFPVNEQNIVPVGSGEALSLPFAEPAFLNHLEDNRVDAHLCFYPQGFEAEVGTQAAIPAKVVGESPTSP